MREKCELVVRARAVMEDVTCRYVSLSLRVKRDTPQTRGERVIYFSFFFQAAEVEGSLQSDETDGVLAACGSDAVRSARRIDEVAWETVQAVKGDRLPLRARRRRLPSHRRGIRLSGMRAQRWP